MPRVTINGKKKKKKKRQFVVNLPVDHRSDAPTVKFEVFLKITFIRSFSHNWIHVGNQKQSPMGRFCPYNERYRILRRPRQQRDKIDPIFWRQQIQGVSLSPWGLSFFVSFLVLFLVFLLLFLSLLALVGCKHVANTCVCNGGRRSGEDCAYNSSM